MFITAVPTPLPPECPPPCQPQTRSSGARYWPPISLDPVLCSGESRATLGAHTVGCALGDTTNFTNSLRKKTNLSSFLPP